jgi:hypothetical protein
MAAIQRTRMSSFGIGAFVVAVSAALLAGASGGYLVRGLTSQVAAPSQPVQYQRITGENQDLTESDLTRAQPADRSTGTNQDLTESDLTRAQPADRSTGTTQLPTWVRNYLAPAASHPFKVDEYIKSLGYAALPGASNEVSAPALQLQP